MNEITSNISSQSNSTAGLRPAVNRVEPGTKTGDSVPSGGTPLPPSNKESNPADSVKEMVELAADLTAYAQNIDRNLEFRVDDESGRTVITVRNSETEEVIRQIPSEEVLRLSAELGSSSAVLFDQFA